MSQALYGTVQCPATAMPALSAATLTAAARAATAALTEMSPAAAATVSSVGWQCPHHSALPFAAFFCLR